VAKQTYELCLRALLRAFENGPGGGAGCATEQLVCFYRYEFDEMLCKLFSMNTHVRFDPNSTLPEGSGISRTNKDSQLNSIYNIEHTELPANLSDYFLRRNKSNINQGISSNSSLRE